ncbi:MAG: dicarboxylate/amino acid:cation symporter [Gammaproteobacteria bacterium]|nr:dicarboxylate/amino acid:cation symporter [Gammaproteobacteria bacterium]
MTKRILWALLLGILLGVLLHGLEHQYVWMKIWVVDGLFLVLGKWFVALLMLMVVPLVFVSLVKGVAQLGASKRLGRLSGLTLVLYVFTTMLAIATGLVLASWVQPGVGLGLLASESSTTTPPNLVELLIAIVPSNPIAAMSQGNMLQVIVFAVLFGLALSTLNNQALSLPVLSLFDGLEAILIRMVGLVMWLAPVGVFVLMARSMASQGLDLLAPLMVYFLTVVAALLLHATVTYASLFRLLTGLSPWHVYRRLKEVLTVSFSTSSSAATLPVTLATTQRLGVSNQVSSFTIPLGATINMDGTAIMQGVATVFIAHAYGLNLTMGDYGLVILTATLASIGTAAVPGAGLIMLTMVLMQVGLPVEGIALILGVDRLLDMMRTSVNVIGDIMVTTIVAERLDALDHSLFLQLENDQPSQSPALIN